MYEILCFWFGCVCWRYGVWDATEAITPSARDYMFPLYENTQRTRDKSASHSHSNRTNSNSCARVGSRMLRRWCCVCASALFYFVACFVHFVRMKWIERKADRRHNMLEIVRLCTRFTSPISMTSLHFREGVCCLSMEKYGNCVAFSGV